MVNIKELIYPNKMKFILFLLLSIPCISLIILLLAMNYSNPEFSNFSASLVSTNLLLFIICLGLIVLVGLGLSYLLGCLIDNFIQNDKIKLLIAITAGIVSLIIVYVFYKIVTEPVICDPVHVPVNNQTICDPVHQPGQGEVQSAQDINALKIDKSAVMGSFEKCVENLKNNYQ